ncbi:MAG: RagB/SusD family nutrient uptake outer membrane protein [Gemmatimonadetes bacterium]|nr:RagB/SusD family nutrient uptake outer membrane protein [Gemmatimonadota bacterium]
MNSRAHESTAAGAVRRIRVRKLRRVVAVLAGTIGVTVIGCDVTNPGPVQDVFLNDKGSHEALVRGAERRVMDGVQRETAYSPIAATTREVFPGGDSNSMAPRVQGGALPEGQGNWNALQEARFIAEDALRRFAQPELQAEPRLLAQAHIWAGYALRILGENWCQAVIAGGPLQPPSAALERAEKHFSDALQGAANDAQRHAAYAGRAQVRLALKNWAGASQDAALVPLSFRLMVTPDPGIDLARNWAGYYNDNTPYRVFTMKHTFFEAYYPATGDPRVPWRTVAGFPFSGSRLTGYNQTPDGRVPWLQLMEEGAQKHYNPGTPVALAKGTEMLLIRAEAILTQTPSNWQQALALINQARASYVSLTTRKALEPWQATSLEDTWTRLKTERHIDGFMQAKRLHDIMRWTRDKTPGQHPWPNWEPLSKIFSSEKPFSTQGICFVVPNSERLANPNIPDDLVS